LKGKSSCGPWSYGSRKDHQKENVTGIANYSDGGVCMKNYSPETPWVHPDAVESFALFLQHSKKKMEGDKNAVYVSDEVDEEDEEEDKIDDKEEDEEDDVSSELIFF